MRVAVVGAGIAGLVAARQLIRDGHDVTVFEATSRVGGRLATEEVSPAGARADSGAQFFTVRNDRFGALVAELEAAGVVHEWCRGFGAEPDGFPRYAARGGMARLAERLAEGLDVRLGHEVRALDELAAEAYVVTPPVPVAVDLLRASGIEPPAALAGTRYRPTIALLVAGLDGPPALAPPGGAQDPGPPFSFVADNVAKGVSGLPAVTFHADEATSARLWDATDADASDQLLAAARPWLGDAAGAGLVTRLVRWPHAGPDPVHPDATVEVAPRVVLAGDAFAGPRVEGAATSGWAAADHLTG